MSSKRGRSSGGLSADTRETVSGSSDANTPETRCSKQERDIMEDFPLDSANPFASQFCDSDVVLIVEGKKLHAHRLILSLYSSFFRVMLGSQQFSEANANEIELKGSQHLHIGYDSMVKFLLYLYPVHSAALFKDNATLMVMFPLADYFQCQHVRVKCESYIRSQLSLAGNEWNFDSSRVDVRNALLYLRLCEQYEATEFIEKLLQILSGKRFSDMQANEHFVGLTPKMQRDVLQKRVSVLEGRISTQNRRVDKLFSGCRLVICDKECCKCGKKDMSYIICRPCFIDFNNLFQDG